MSSRKAQLIEFERLLDLMDELREKCPWDREQTFETLRHLTIEETYELGEAILNKNNDEIMRELGDLLLHIVFYAKIGSEKKTFDFADVAYHISEKLITRHPHIFGNLKVDKSDQVKMNWEAIKLENGKKSVLEGVPKTLPAVVKAFRIQEKVSSIGFDWDNIDGVLSKVKEEIKELKKEIHKKNSKNIESEFGDLLFSLINYARFLKINPESALERCNQKFIKRFNYIEAEANAVGKKINELNISEMEKLWKESKL